MDFYFFFANSLIFNFKITSRNYKILDFCQQFLIKGDFINLVAGNSLKNFSRLLKKIDGQILK